jgi:glycosyltransferase involved in cell wall biosynthesis
MPLISCIVPTHNGQKFLAETVRSLLAQTYRPIEVIVVVDSSTDSSFEIAAAFGWPVRVVRIDASNPVVARNVGICLAKGEYLAFLDHDDLSPTDRLNVQYDAFARDPALEVSVGMIQRFTQPTTASIKVDAGAPVPGYLTISMLARRQAFDRVGILNPQQRYSDSAEWFLRARKVNCRVELLRQIVTYHRIHAQSLSIQGNDEARREFLRLVRTKLHSE